MTHDSLNASLKIPTAVPLLVGGLTVGIFCFGMCKCKQCFHGLYIQFQNDWDFKGMADSLDSGFPRGAKAPCWHTILHCKV